MRDFRAEPPNRARAEAEKSIKKIQQQIHEVRHTCHDVSWKVSHVMYVVF